MRFPQIPNIDTAWEEVIIDALSPSNFSWVNQGCGYQALLNKVLGTFNDKALSLPPSKNALLGTIIHKLYELTIKGELKSIADMKERWEELITNKKEELSTYYPTLHNASLNDYDKRNCAIRYAMSIMRIDHHETCVESKQKVLSEKWLDCSKIGLKGKADKIVLYDGAFDIVDYKSGLVLGDNGTPKKEYCDQLHLYAAMCQSLSMGFPRNLSLVDINGEYFNIPFSQEYCNQLLSAVKGTLDLLNAAVRARDFKPLAKPELGFCSYCNCRHICKYREIPLDAYYQTIAGTVSATPSTNLIILQNEGNPIYISGLDIYCVDTLDNYLGKQLTFVNVIRTSPTTDDYSYKITENTLVYELL